MKKPKSKGLRKDTKRIMADTRMLDSGDSSSSQINTALVINREVIHREFVQLFPHEYSGFVKEEKDELIIRKIEIVKANKYISDSMRAPSIDDRVWHENLTKRAQTIYRFIYDYAEDKDYKRMSIMPRKGREAIGSLLAILSSNSFYSFNFFNEDKHRNTSFNQTRYERLVYQYSSGTDFKILVDSKMKPMIKVAKDAEYLKKHRLSKDKMMTLSSGTMKRAIFIKDVRKVAGDLRIELMKQMKWIEDWERKMINSIPKTMNDALENNEYKKKYKQGLEEFEVLDEFEKEKYEWDNEKYARHMAEEELHSAYLRIGTNEELYKQFLHDIDTLNDLSFKLKEELLQLRYYFRPPTSEKISDIEMFKCPEETQENSRPSRE